jgi:hypothetical protein
MASPPLHAAVAALRTRLLAEIDEQLSAVEAAGAAAVAEAHRSAHAAADERWTARFEELQAQAALSRPGPGALEVADVQTGASAPPDPRAASLRRLALAVRALDAATSLSATLDSLSDAARLEAARTALFVVNGPGLERWAASGFDPGLEPAAQLTLAEAGPLAQAVHTGQSGCIEPTAAPGFAAGRAGAVAPLAVGGQCVAVLYADGNDPIESVRDAIGILAGHASSCLARLTAEALAKVPSALTVGTDAPGRDDDSSARRYARLLVSEIKLYNESAVRVGRERRDLLTRLRPEIDRARRVYQERVPDSIGARDQLFEQELVHTLAEGDPALLGAPDRS